jgi:hypothetical protein
MNFRNCLHTNNNNNNNNTKQRLISLRFLVLSLCDFGDEGLQTLLKNTKSVEHISLRYCQWEGTISFPSSLLSLSYFPSEDITSYYSLKCCTKLWQISVCLEKNDKEAIEFLNQCSTNPHIKQVRLKIIPSQFSETRYMNLKQMKKWEEREDHDFTVVINKEDLAFYPIITEKIPVSLENIFSLKSVKFEDCPFWSDESLSFIHIANRRKLLLR